MRIGGISGYDVMSSEMSAKNIKTELAGAKSKVNELVYDKEAEATETNKERRKAQEEISRLNRELYLEELESQRAKRQEKLADMTSSLKEEEKPWQIEEEDKPWSVEEEDKPWQIEEEDKIEQFKDKKEAEEKMSESYDEAIDAATDIFTAQDAMEQMNVKGNVSNAIDNKVSVLEAEINTDKGRGTDTTFKEEQLEELKEIQINSVLDNYSIGEEMDSETVMNRFGAGIGMAANSGEFAMEHPKVVIS